MNNDKPTAKQLAYAMKIAATLGETLRRADQANRVALSCWIEERETRFKAARSKGSALPKGALAKKRGGGFKGASGGAWSNGRRGISSATANALYLKATRPI